MNSPLIYRFFPFVLLILVMSSCVHRTDVSLDEQLATAFENISPTNELSYFVFPEPGDYANIPNQDPNNPINQAKVDLGQLLYFETGFATESFHENAQETYSCGSCHIASRGFTPGALQGIADGGIGFGVAGEGRIMWNIFQEEELDVQGIRPLSMINTAYVTNTFWNGQFGAHGVNADTEYCWDNDPVFEVNHAGFEGQETQHIEGIPNHRLGVTTDFLDEYGYRSYYDAAFPHFSQEERYTDTTSSMAIGAYLRTIFAHKAPFQEWLKGDMDAISESQKKGALLFVGKAGCIQCHYSPSFNSMEFHRLGVKDMHENPSALFTAVDDSKNLGRGSFTGLPEDMRKFKVPQLYNVSDYATYFHGSSKTSLYDVLKYKIDAKSENQYVLDSELSPKFKPLDLTEIEKQQLLDFLENALRDPDMDRYLPDHILSGNCFPNNDPFSQVETGCN